jgi:hypothetical protein
MNKKIFYILIIILLFLGAKNSFLDVAQFKNNNYNGYYILIDYKFYNVLRILNKNKPLEDIYINKYNKYIVLDSN